jgi:putative transcriptional regulator
MLYWKVDIIEELRKAGYSSYKIRKESLLAEGTMQKLRNGGGVGWENLDRICKMLDCDISDIVGTDNTK